MDNLSEKPKRKRKDGSNPTLYLVAGIVIGTLVTALLIAGFLFLGTSNSVETSVASNAVTVVPSLFPTATPFPMTAQPQSFQLQPTVIAHRVYSAHLSPDGRYLATIVQEDTDTAVYLAELRVQRNLANLQRYTLHRERGLFYDVVFSPSGDKLVVTADSGRTLIFDTNAREILETLSPYSHAAFSPDGELLALAGNADGLRILNAATLSLLDARQLDDPYLRGLAFNNQNQLAIATSHQVHVWNPYDLQQAPILYPANVNIYDIAFHPDGNWLAVASEGSVLVLDTSSSERKVYDFDTQRILSVAFSADGSWMAAAGGDSGIGAGSIFAFRWQQSDIIPPDPTYYDVVEFGGNNHIVHDVKFTQDGLLLSAGWDGSVRLWDVTTGQEISRMQL